jgi:hypothetical protein
MNSVFPNFYLGFHLGFNSTFKWGFEGSEKATTGGVEWEPIKIPQGSLAYILKSTQRASLLARPRPHSYWRVTQCLTHISPNTLRAWPRTHHENTWRMSKTRATHHENTWKMSKTWATHYENTWRMSKTQTFWSETQEQYRLNKIATRTGITYGQNKHVVPDLWRQWMNLLTKPRQRVQTLGGKQMPVRTAQKPRRTSSGFQIKAGGENEILSQLTAD